MPQEGGRGAEEVGQRLSDYQRLVRRRAAQTSREIKAEQDVKLKLAQATRDRLQAAKDFGTRVAVGNAKVLLRNKAAASAVEVAHEEVAVPVASARPAPAASGPTVPPARPPAPKGLCVPDQLMLEKEHYPPSPPTPPPKAKDEALLDQSVQTPVEEPRRPPASVLARQRLLSHCPAESTSAAALAELANLNRSLGVTPADVARSPELLPQPGGFRTRVLQPVQAANVPGAGSPSPSGKLYKGKLLPVAISSTDKLGLSRVAQKVADLGDKLMLPRLCSCPNNASPFDPLYVQKCARNCPLYGQTARYQALLTSILKAADVI
ncbi:hypothetical protein CHLRE_12g521100v5 [Chlamydomonas reinhardtii]|uniref:Uncharacterized protein n=1 Tax=Chlamydomonas reinhardtii TaxID=3055 RepID=A0A2K3D437_CHLRE|nr:uncharacterized protein CHLRE_12g521100v5 [Chlamydomonas reinhardtii]PNW75295.1 hypothetical protein CHLRE_12g521100v5 [Chlamydomonas reinhardtii]